MNANQTTEQTEYKTMYELQQDSTCKECDGTSKYAQSRFGMIKSYHYYRCENCNHKRVLEVRHI